MGLSKEAAEAVENGNISTEEMQEAWATKVKNMGTMPYAPRSFQLWHMMLDAIWCCPFMISGFFWVSFASMEDQPLMYMTGITWLLVFASNIPNYYYSDIENVPEHAFTYRLYGMFMFTATILFGINSNWLSWLPSIINDGLGLIRLAVMITVAFFCWFIVPVTISRIVSIFTGREF